MRVLLTASKHHVKLVAMVGMGSVAKSKLRSKQDEFEGKNKGLILAEIELKSEDEAFSIPPWIGTEVTGDLRYYNSRLACYPFSNWQIIN